MSLTPMMNQYLQVKEKCKDCILFFRLGDFYEMFFDDAVQASKELELVLTGRDCGLEKRAPMCGIPYHAANNYIGRLISKGYKIAICEQLEEATAGKGIVERDIIKIITPGTYTDTNFLEDTKNNYIMSLYLFEEKVGICFADISTGDFFCTYSSLNSESILEEIYKFSPSEILTCDDFPEKIKEDILSVFTSIFTIKPIEFFNNNPKENIKKQFIYAQLEEIEESTLFSASGLLNYIYETQKISLTNLKNFEVYNSIDYLSIDINSRRNLELIENTREKSKKGSLLWVLDKTSTSMGGRRIRKWIEQPLIHKPTIEKRVNSVEELINSYSIHEDLKEDLKEIYDIERIVGRVSSKTVNGKELISLKNSLGKIPNVKETLSKCNTSMLTDMYDNLDTLEDVFNLLEESINENAPITIKEGNLIKEGFNEEIDELKKAKLKGKEWIANLEKSERDITGIRSLKVGYNKVFGYYIEITKANFDSIPEGRYIRKQTLSNAERYITPELKEMEDKILGAEEKLINLEYEVFVQIRNKIESHIDRMQQSAHILSEIDCLCSLATVARDNNYCKPNITDNGIISIENGRHPVIEKYISSGSFVSNNTYLDTINDQLLLITGPNMAGKSTYMRQVALITLMAQMGSFIPASKASISICDKIFTRIGASDDIAAGKSTFMVEMWEVSNILKNATNNSLVLLDEVGRGTSTYDGLSIAWAVIEYMCNTEKLRCKTLFATHYHELIRLEGKIPGVKNYSVAVKKIGDEIAFLHKIIPGGVDESYGIEVAKLAGLPDELTSRAKNILSNLEKAPKEEKKVKNEQIGLFDFEKDKFIKKVKKIDVNSLTPLDGLNKLNDLVQEVKKI